MMLPHEGQARFAAALMNPALAVPSGLVGPDGRESARRFDVYRNNVVLGLIETLRESYPATARIVGDEFFRAMARSFVAARPPQSPIMLHYGAGFAEFIADFEPAASLPYLPDVARIERAWLESYHAADAAPLEASAFAALGQAQLPSLRLVLHPALRFAASPFPALTIWQMNVSGEPAEIDLTIPEECIIHRPAWEVEARQVPRGTATFMAALGEAQTVLNAAKAAWIAAPDFDLGAVLGGLVACGAFIGFEQGPDIEND
jgi:hypothetical protein